MAIKPSFRDSDPNPKRGDDIRLSFMGAMIEGSGRTVTALLIAVVLAIVCGGLTIAGYWMTKDQVEKHDWRTAGDHAQLVQAITEMSDAMETMTCVLTLNDVERVVFRETRKYCGSYNDQLRRQEREIKRLERP